MKTTEELVISYAENRIAFRNVKDEIHKLMSPRNENGEYIFGIPEKDTIQAKMTSVRNDWFDGGDMYSYNAWPEGGWTEVLTDLDIEDPDMLRLAALWDERKAIVISAGNIKRAIAARGRALLRKQP
ncbi:MAG: hypothetical protein KOO63_08340 [Bacteroidales bacterium]|nr:hypothetical protein [Candidatus Latescibacterota bacterium]